MATINKNLVSSSLPVAFSRGEPIPIDKSLVWYSLEELQAYVQSSTCYVGQILSLVDEAANTATVYVVADTNGTLKEAGAATLGDNKTIVLDTDSGVLSLKNWGIEYYKWVDAVGEEGGDDYVAAHHEKQTVDETHPWIAGLEPKAVVGSDGTFEIAWYQPSTTTVEGLSSTVSTVQTTVNEITNALGDTETEGTIRYDIANKLDLAGGTMAGDIVLQDGGKAISDTAVANLIASAGHLVRSVVEVLPDAADANADTIYMVKDESVESGDAYKEYMLIDGILVQIGDTSVNLEPYATKTALAAVEGALTSHTANTDIHITAAEREGWNGKVDAEEGKSLVADDLITKLGDLVSIKSVGEGLTLDPETGALTSVAKAASEIAEEIADGATLEAVEGKLVVKTASATNAGIISAADFVKIQNIEEGAQKNVVNGLIIGDEEAEINEDKKIVLPIATGALLGVVKSSEEDNKVKVLDDGSMEINRISASKLYVEEDDELVLSGGNA